MGDSGMLVDNFAGGGGASLGIEWGAGRPVDLAVNHDVAAIAMHSANHPNTVHLQEDVWDVDPLAVTAGRRVRLAWFSPDCTHFSKAKGGQPRSKKIRGLAWVAVRWAQALAPKGRLDMVMLENVEEFQEWGPLGVDERPCPARKGQTFHRWISQMRRLGGVVDWRELVAADFGEATIRKRLFVVVRFDGLPIVWPEQTHARDPGVSLFTQHLPKWRAAAECIDWSLACPSIFERARPLAENTMARVAAGLRKYVLEAAEPFIVGIDNKSSGPGAVWPVGEPLRTITAENRFALVAPSLVQVGYGEREGQHPRALDISKPLGTIVGTGKHALVAAFLAKHYTGVIGQGIEVPLRTVTARDHHSLVCAFLTKYYGTGTGQVLQEPMATITSKDRMGLVTVRAERYRVVDIGLRMLQPHELSAAQGFPATYQLVGTKSAQVARIGNSVCPRVVAALVRANFMASRMKQAV